MLHRPMNGGGIITVMQLEFVLEAGANQMAIQAEYLIGFAQST